MDIRRMIETDIGQVIEIAHEFYEEQLCKAGVLLEDDEILSDEMKAVMRSHNCLTLVSVENDIVTGVISGFINKRMFFKGIACQELIWFVRRDKRVDGIKLLKEFEKMCIDLGCSEIIMVAFTNTKAEGIYNKFGYSKLETNFQKKLGG